MDKFEYVFNYTSFTKVINLALPQRLAYVVNSSIVPS